MVCINVLLSVVSDVLQPECCWKYCSFAMLQELEAQVALRDMEVQQLQQRLNDVSFTHILEQSQPAPERNANSDAILRCCAPGQFGDEQHWAQTRSVDSLPSMTQQHVLQATEAQNIQLRAALRALTEEMQQLKQEQLPLFATRKDPCKTTDEVLKDSSNSHHNTPQVDVSKWDDHLIVVITLSGYAASEHICIKPSHVSVRGNISFNKTILLQGAKESQSPQRRGTSIEG